MAAVSECQTDTVEVVEEFEDGQWSERSCVLSQVLNASDRVLTTILFVHNYQLQDLFHTQSAKPSRERFLRLTRRDISGSLYCNFEGSTTNLTSHTSWTIYKIKEVKSNQDYRWLQCGVFVEWNIATRKQTVVFIDIPPPLILQLKRNLRVSAGLTHTGAPFLWHLLLVEECVNLYEASFWLLRDIVRAEEKNRLSGFTHTQNIDFALLHDTARHIFHLKETIESAEHTVQNLIVEIEKWGASIEYAGALQLPVDNNNGTSKGTGAGSASISWTQIKGDLRYMEKELFSEKLRARGLWERQDNEINYALNIAGHQAREDSAKARSDSAAMKTIAVLGLLYLPGSFVSGLFGTNFFNLSTEGSNQEWVVSENFWLYWLITVPLTALTVVVWAWPSFVLGVVDESVRWVNWVKLKTKLKRLPNKKGAV
ncbi:hypothetical protein BDW74DRAFT_179362 [Aspergillus multicolor]|uniref:uncharacterized protein n=1 Tax=Aspergillus multicolor TaxID=41759 RepID=UPI003CCD64F5